jgi:hypothetical protein
MSPFLETQRHSFPCIGLSNPGVFPFDPATENVGVRAASASRVSKMAPVRDLFNQRVQKLDDFHFTAAQYGLAIAEEQHIKVVVEQFA